jgi:Holliday junction resolvase RusA-like endonuclease
MNGSIVEYDEVLTMEILGQPPRKSNSRRITKWGGIIKSDEALQYVQDFILQAQYYGEPLGNLNQDLRVDIAVWYKNRRPDLSIELILDCLEKAGVIKNDRYVREHHVYGFVDKENPRVHIKIYTIGGERTPPF